MTSDEMREAVARVIEPYGFALQAARHMPERYGVLCERALAKADAILSMISASPVEEENKRLREALEPFARVADHLTQARYGPAWGFNGCVVEHEDFRRARALTNNNSTGSPAESETSGGVG